LNPLASGTHLAPLSRVSVALRARPRSASFAMSPSVGARPAVPSDAIAIETFIDRWGKTVLH